MEQLREAFPMIDPNDLTGILGMAGGDPDVACDIVNEILSQLPPDEPGADLGYVTVGAAPDLPGALAVLDSSTEEGVDGPMKLEEALEAFAMFVGVAGLRRWSAAH